MNRHGPLAVLAAAGLMVLGGCSNKPAPAPVVAPQVSPGAPAPTPTTAPSAATPSAPAPTPDEGPRNDPGIEALNIAISDYFSANGTVPKDVSELVRGKFLDKLPVPPPGKRYVIDPTRRQAKLAGK